MLDKIKTPLKLKNPDLLREQSYINGAWASAADKGTFAVTNPADGSLLANVAQLGVAETRQAIAAASAAWPTWRIRMTCSSFCTATGPFAKPFRI